MYPGVDTERPNVARIYDYLLGGTHNFAVDRDAARAAIAIEPSAREAAKANRAFLGRAVNAMRRLNTRLRAPGSFRGHTEISGFFDGLDLVEPGLDSRPNPKECKRVG